MTALLGSAAVASVVILAAQAWLRTFDDVQGLLAPFPSFVDHAQAGLQTFMVLAECAAGIPFLFWVYRAFQNLPALGSTKTRIAPGQRATPGRAVTSFFMPFTNLVLGYRAVRHLWRESQPQPATLPDGTTLPPRETLLGWWWTAYLLRLACSLATRSTSSREIRTFAEWKALSTQNILPLLVDAVAAILCVLVVRTITQRQEEQQRDILLRVPAPPVTDQLR